MLGLFIFVKNQVGNYFVVQQRCETFYFKQHYLNDVCGIQFTAEQYKSQTSIDSTAIESNIFVTNDEQPFKTTYVQRKMNNDRV